MPHDHHHHDHDHDHDHAVLPPEPALRVKALETLLTEKGLVDPAALDAIIDIYQNQVGPQNGALVVAKAWADPVFKARLLADATEVVAELGFYGRQGEHITVVENTPERHNVIVCTLCSCYPWPLLGIPPGWYKSDAYLGAGGAGAEGCIGGIRRGFAGGASSTGLGFTAEMRYLVLPMRPEGTEGMSVEELAALVTRDAMVGTGLATVPQ